MFAHIFHFVSILFTDLILHLHVNSKHIASSDMKKIFLLSAFLFFLTNQMVFAQAVITLEKSTHDFGTFGEDEKQEAVFKLKNTGNEPLVIHQAITSCGCTVAEFTKTPIKVGEEGEVKITYNGKGKLFGKFKKSITVRSNAKPSITRLYISGNMTEEKKQKEEK